MAPVEKHSLKFLCALEVVLPSYECRSTGVGMAEEPVDKLEEGLFSSMYGGLGGGISLFPSLSKTSFQIHHHP